MTFVIVNKDLDLSVGSTYGLVGDRLLHRSSRRPISTSASGPAVVWCLLIGLADRPHQRRAGHDPQGAGLHRHADHAVHRPRLRARPHRRQDHRLRATRRSDFPGSSSSARPTPRLQQPDPRSSCVVAVVGAVVLAKTRIGYETFAIGGNEQAASYAGIPTRWVRMRAYLLSSLCATIAGLMTSPRTRASPPSTGLGAELIVIASVIIGGASILGGRGRVLGACLGAILVVLIDKVLREGCPITRIDRGRRRSRCRCRRWPSCRPARCRPSSASSCSSRCWSSPGSSARGCSARLWARLRGRPPPPAPRSAAIAIEGVADQGRDRAADRALRRRGFAQVPRPARRAGDHAHGRAVAGRPLAPAGLLGRPRQQLRPSARLHRDRAARRRAHLSSSPTATSTSRSASVLALRGRDRRLPDEGARLSIPAGRRAGRLPRPALLRRLRQRPADGRLRPAGLRRHAGHVLHRPRPRRLDRRRARSSPAFRRASI